MVKDADKAKLNRMGILSIFKALPPGRGEGSLSLRLKKYFGFGGFQGKDTWLSRNWWLLLSLGGILILGLLLRAYFYYPYASDLGFSGNDPYYHKRVIDYVQQHHQHLIFDKLLNYPVQGINPRPPFYNWMIAVFGVMLSPFFGFDVGQSTNTIMYLAPSFWGALTMFPVYFIAKEMFGKKTAVVSAFLMATMPSHIERSPAGFSDHDSIVVFFVVLSIFFLFRAFRTLKHKDWVENWMSANSIYDGITDFFGTNREPVYYSLLSGVSLATIALTWKGFPYALAIIFIYFLFQLMFDRFRHVDSTGIFICTFLAFFSALAISFPYYMRLSFGTWITPFYLLLAIVTLGAFLIPTRDYPWIVVIPLGAIIAVVGYLTLSILAPNAAQALVTGQGYFIKTKLYETIAEAQPPQFSRLAVSYAIFVFFLALIGIIKAAWQIPKHWKKENIFIVVWAAVAVYMAMSAVRFMFNATPVIAITAGWILYGLIKKINIKSKVLIFYTLGLAFSLLLLSWWGVEHGFGEKYTWLIFMGILTLLVIPIIVAIYDNYDKKVTFLFMGGMLAVWTVIALVMLIVNEDLKWGGIGEALLAHLNIWYFGMAALALTVLPILIFIARKRLAITHLIVITALSLLIVALEGAGWFDSMIMSKTAKTFFGYSLIPILIFLFNIYFLFMDESYRKRKARKFLLLGIEIWFLSFFFDPNIYTGVLALLLLLVNIYVLSPYRRSYKHKTKPMHVLITLFVVLIVLLPQLWFAIDASLPYEKKGEMNQNVYSAMPNFLHSEKASSNKYFGAFGHGFTSEYWRAAFEWLSRQDADIPPEERPAFISWWDYGFWAAYLGQHPTAADNFQYGYQFAGSFISAENETKAVGLMIGRLIEGNVEEKGTAEEIKGILTKEKYFGEEKAYKSIIDSSKINASEKVFEICEYPEKYIEVVKNDPERHGRYLQLLPKNAKYAAIWGLLIPLGKERLIDLMADIERATGESLRYFAVDSRLFPFSAQNTGIFYAPIKLADKDIEDYLEYKVVLTDGREFSVDEFEGMVEEDPDLREQVKDYKLKYTDLFYDSMFYRCYIGYSGKDLGKGDQGVPVLSPKEDFASQNFYYPMQGWNMTHFRLVYKTMYYTPKDQKNASFPEDYTAMNFEKAQELFQKKGGYRISGLRSGAFFLKYYHGARLEGRVMTEGEDGQPMPNVRVVAYDEYDIPHDMTFTDENGNYRLTLPFGKVTVTVSKDGYPSGREGQYSRLIMKEKTVLNETTLHITDDQAMRREDWEIDKDLLIKRAAVNGKVYTDLNHNDEFDDRTDKIAESAKVFLRSKDKRNITYSGRMRDGVYNFTNVLPSKYGLEVEMAGHAIDVNETVEVKPAGNKNLNVFTKDLGIAPGNISGNLSYANGTPAGSIEILLRDNENATIFKATTNGSGHYYFNDLLPGNFTLMVEEPLYRSVSDKVKIELGDRKVKNLTLEEVVPVFGKVYFDQGSDGMDPEDGMSRARIKFVNKILPTAIDTVVTDKNGNYRTNLSQGEFVIYVHYLMSGEHLAFLGERIFDLGTAKRLDIPLKPAVRIEGELSIGGNLSNEQNINLTKMASVTFRSSAGEYSVLTNESSYFVAYLPEGEYHIFIPVPLMESFMVGATSVKGTGGEVHKLDLVSEPAEFVSGYVFWDRNGDGNLTMGNKTLDVMKVIRSFKENPPPPPEPGGLAPEGGPAPGPTPRPTVPPLPQDGEGPSGGTRGDEGEDAAPDPEGTDIPLVPDIPFGPNASENNTQVEDTDMGLYENVTDIVYIYFEKGETEIRTLINQTGYFNQPLPLGKYTMRIASDEIEAYETEIEVKKGGENIFVPSVKGQNISFDLDLGIDRNRDENISTEEEIGFYEIMFEGKSPGSENATFVIKRGEGDGLDLSPGDYRVLYHKEFVESGTEIIHDLDENITLELGDEHREFRFFVRERIRFEGTVRTENDELASNATLRLNSSDAGHSAVIECDENGNFNSFLPFGRYLIRSEHTVGSNTYLYNSLVDIMPRRSTYSLLLDRAYPLNLTLYFDDNRDGRFQVEEKLINTPFSLGDLVKKSHTTDYNGKVSTWLLPGREYEVVIDHFSADSSYRYLTREKFTMADNALDIELPVQKYVRVRGDVYWDKNRNGKASSDEMIANATLDFGFGENGEIYESASDTDGEWEIYVPVFRNSSQIYNITCSAEGFVGKSLTKKVDLSHSTLDIVLEPEVVRYQGVLYEDLDDNDTRNAGEPVIPQRSVKMVSESETGVNVTFSSDAEGRYDAYIYPGKYSMKSLIKDDRVFILSRKETVELGEDKELNIGLKKGKYVHGAIYYEDTNGVQHRDIDVQDNEIIIEAEEGDHKVEVPFYDGFYETYLALGRYTFEMKGYTSEEYGMDMEYEYSENTHRINEESESLDLPLQKIMETDLELSVLNFAEDAVFNRTVNRGATVDLEVLVENKGNVPQNVTLSGKDMPDGWELDIAPNELDLHIGESGTSKISVHTSSDSYHANTFEISADPTRGSGDDIELKIDTYPIHRVDVFSPDLLERGFMPNTTKTFNITVLNRGNAGDELTFYLKGANAPLWDITIQGEDLNSTGYSHEYGQEDTYKNVSVKVSAPNATAGTGRFEIGVKGKGVTPGKSIRIDAEISEPDIVIEDVRFENLDLSDKDKNVSVYVTLRCKYADVGKFNFTAYLDGKKVGNLTESVNGMEQGTTRTLFFDWNLSDEKGDHKLKLFVDQDDRIPEKDDVENNRWIEEDFRVGPGEEGFNWRIVIAVVVVLVIAIASLIIWKKKQIV